MRMAAKWAKSRLVMVNSMCQLDRAMGYPDIWLNIFLGMHVRMFLDEINI